MAETLPCSYASPKLVGRSDPAKGRAVFCVAPIEAGEVLAIWGGLIIPLAHALSLTEAQMTQCVQVEDDFVLWTGALPQNEADWINHSCDPNAGMSGQISVVALRDIAPGEEVCIDYAMVTSRDIDAFVCACRTTQCRGQVTAEDWRHPDLQARYGSHFSSFLNTKIAALNASRA